MSKTLWVTLYSGHDIKEKYKHEKLFSLYQSWDIESARAYLSKHIWYFIQQAWWAVNEELYARTFAEAFNLIDEQVQKQIEKMWSDINYIKSGRYLVLRLRWQLLNTQIKDKKTLETEYVKPEDEDESLFWTDTDLIHSHFSNLWITDEEKEVFLLKHSWLWEEAIRKEVKLSRGRYRNLLNRAKKKLANYYQSQWINETSYHAT